MANDGEFPAIKIPIGGVSVPGVDKSIDLVPQLTYFGERLYAHFKALPNGKIGVTVNELIPTDEPTAFPDRPKAAMMVELDYRGNLAMAENIATQYGGHSLGFALRIDPSLNVINLAISEAALPMHEALVEEVTKSVEFRFVAIQDGADATGTYTVHWIDPIRVDDPAHHQTGRILFLPEESPGEFGPMFLAVDARP
jgi:hypothetical protein